MFSERADVDRANRAVDAAKAGRDAEEVPNIHSSRAFDDAGVPRVRSFRRDGGTTKGSMMLVGSVEATLLVLLLIIVFGPIVAQRFRVPGIIGLIAGGVIAGPFVLGWLRNFGLVAELGAIGILYLMFLAGLGFSIRGFVTNRNNAIVYGLLGFVIPFSLSMWVVLTWFDISVLGAALIGAMWASNTLVAYPDVKAAGLQNNRAVSAAVSAGVVADLLSLTVLALVTSTAVIEVDIDGGLGIEPTVGDPTLPVWLAIPLLVAFTMWILPKVVRWFFVNVGHTRMQRFVFVLAGMAAGATVAVLGGIEGLIGAFLAGLGMNTLVPEKGQLMERLDFVGTALFIPAFLVSIGLNIDPSVLFDAETLLLGLVFTGFVIVGKTAAAAITALIFHLSWNEVGLMSSLSFGQAASTLAIAQVGLNLGMFGQETVNAAVLAIVATALITSFGTLFFIRRVPRHEAPSAPIGQNVLVDIRPQGSDIDALMTFSAGLARPDDGLVVPFAIPSPGHSDAAKVKVGAAAAAAASLGLDSDGIIRVDDSFEDGTLSLIEETGASVVLLAWGGPRIASDFMFGSAIDRVGERCPVPMMAVRIVRPWSRIVAVTGRMDLDWRREDANLVLAALRRLRRAADVPVVVVTRNRPLVEGAVGELDTVQFVVEERERKAITDLLKPDDLVITSAHVIHDLPAVMGWRTMRTLQDLNLAVVAGPHRLSMSRSLSPVSVRATIDATA
ncbi:MAG: cation:proton antiporter [Acidimicrobiia bacterium]